MLRGYPMNPKPQRVDGIQLQAWKPETAERVLVYRSCGDVWGLRGNRQGLRAHIAAMVFRWYSWSVVEFEGSCLGGGGNDYRVIL